MHPIDWGKLGSRQPRNLTEARLSCHHAVQLLTHVARGYLPAQPDDSHTSLGWDRKLRALAGRVIPAPSGLFSLALRIEDLTLLVANANAEPSDHFALAGRTLSEASLWVAGGLSGRGLDPAPFHAPLHFRIPEHPVANGAPFALGDREAFRELARYYGNAAAAITQLARRNAPSSPVRCWPHHFDIATLIALGGEGEQARTIGFGLSPGDGSYDQPYFYASPWPYPDASRLPRLHNGGRWHTEGWTGAVLTGEALLHFDSAGEQSGCVERFAGEAVSALRQVLSAV